MKSVYSKHILVIRLSAMGDVAMIVPVLRAFVKQNPDIKITIVSNGFFEPIFEGIPNVNFYPAKVKGKHKGVLGLFKLSKELKRLKIDAIADVHDVLRSKILRFFFFGKKGAIINKGRAEKKALTRPNNKVFKQLTTTHERYADVFRELGYRVDLSNPEFPKKKNIPQFVSSLLEQVGDRRKWIGIAPFAQHESKMYPLDLIEKVISNLVTTNQYQIFLFGGGAQETKKLKVLASTFENIISIAGKISFTEELNLVSNLDGMLSMDSANAHLAAMFNVKTITLWGGTHPFAGFAAFNQPKEHLLIPDLEKYPKLPCSIYGNKLCEGYHEVMRSISPEKVIDCIKNNI